MIEYSISYQNPNSHILDIEVNIKDLEGDSLVVNLPSWRPGRYELANYAKNVYRMDAHSYDGEALICKKVTKDQWEIKTRGNKSVKLKYAYYAFQMDAGNSWLDHEQLYVNPINCLVYIKDRIYEKCSLDVKVPASYKIATGLRKIDPGKYVAKDYFELSDCPVFASESLRSIQYSVDEINFNIWIQGDNFLNEEQLLNDFTKFSQYQVEMMTEFPEKEYHFMFQFLPYAFRHGVEHRNSTVITMGPSHLISTTLYADLLGISSHELFHSWNVLKIRPKELTPYDFSRENYYETGYATEGFTTYYGDLLLARSKVYSLDQYLVELNDLLKKHFENEGNLNLSLAESSFDLWLDGYVPGIPGRKVSIYVKGALVSFLIDVHLRKTTNNRFSLDDIMRALWKGFGKKEVGFQECDLLEIADGLGVDLKALIERTVYSTGYLQNELVKSFNYLGLELSFTSGLFPLESEYGIKCIHSNSKWIVDKIHNESEAFRFLSKGDEVVAIDDQKFDPTQSLNDSINLTFLRGNKVFNESLKRSDKILFPVPVLRLKETLTVDEEMNIKKWLDIKSI